MAAQRTLSNKLIKKLSLTFLLLILLVGTTYIIITIYLGNKYFEETTQKLNSEIASHLIHEKFQNDSPFLEDGSVNKPLFGDIMHDMMAVNHGIEVYLLDTEGYVLYSVVLNHNENEQMKRVDLGPVEYFISTEGQEYIVGDDPLNPEEKKIFSAARFNEDGHEGYIYIILAGQEFEAVTASLLASYFMRLGTGVTLTTLILALLIGLLAIWYLTKNLRDIIYTVSDLVTET